ncbi:hypothetical protein PtB15_8B159 [Puccinia triticina]|nr:hypothetical protein PtB15_8B159 [Puccinia triticina]
MNAKHLAALVGVPLAVLGLCLATIHLRIGAALHRSRPPPDPARLSLRDAQTTLHLRLRFPGPAQLPRLLTRRTLTLRLALRDLRLRLDTHPDQHSWTDALFRSLAHLRLPHLTLHLPVTLPKVPAEWADPAALLTLSTYAFFPIPAEDTSDGRAGVGIRATVAAPNPLLLLRRHIRELDVAVDVPWPIPLSVLLVHGPRHRLVPLASSHTLPFLAGKPNSLAVRYAGIPRALPAADPRANQIPLSLSAAEVGAPKVPTLISAFLSTLDLRLQFPGSPTPDLLESLEIREMHIGLPGLFPPRAPLRCSGVLHALVVLPAELAGLAGMLDIRLFRPDVVLLDGPLPPSPSAEDGLPESATAVFRRYAAKYVLHHRTNTSKPGEGVQTSMLGTFDAKAFVAGRFRVALRRVAVRGSFFV